MSLSTIFAKKWLQSTEFTKNWLQSTVFAKNWLYSTVFAKNWPKYKDKVDALFLQESEATASGAIPCSEELREKVDVFEFLRQNISHKKWPHFWS